MLQNKVHVAGRKFAVVLRRVKQTRVTQSVVSPICTCRRQNRRLRLKDVIVRLLHTSGPRYSVTREHYGRSFSIMFILLCLFFVCFLLA